MNPRSVAKTLPGERAAFPATLKGYRRKTNAPFDGYAYMNIVEDAEASVEGIIIPLTLAELAILEKREEGYEQVDVTGQIDASVTGKVFAFIMPNAADSGLKVPRSYLLTCLQGVSENKRDRWISETLIPEGIEEDLENPVYPYVAIE